MLFSEKIFLAASEKLLYLSCFPLRFDTRYSIISKHTSFDRLGTLKYI